MRRGQPASQAAPQPSRRRLPAARALTLPPPPPAPPERSMCLGRSPATGARYLAVPLFAVATVLLWGWFAAVFALNARARRKLAAA